MVKNYLSLRRAAARLGIHHATLSRAVKRGEIAPEFVTPGGVMRFAESDVERFQRQRLNYKNRNSDDAPPNNLKDAGAFGPEGLSRVDELLHSIPDTARDLVGAQYAALAVMSNSGELVGFITSGLTEEQRDAIGSPPKGKGMLGLIQELSVSVRSADLTKHPGSSGFPPNHPPMASFLGVPVMLNGENIGNLYLTNKIDARLLAALEKKERRSVAEKKVTGVRALVGYGFLGISALFLVAEFFHLVPHEKSLTHWILQGAPLLIGLALVAPDALMQVGSLIAKVRGLRLTIKEGDK